MIEAIERLTERDTAQQYRALDAGGPKPPAPQEQQLLLTQQQQLLALQHQLQQSFGEQRSEMLALRQQQQQQQSGGGTGGGDSSGGPVTLGSAGAAALEKLEGQVRAVNQQLEINQVRALLANAASLARAPLTLPPRPMLAPPPPPLLLALRNARRSS